MFGRPVLVPTVIGLLAVHFASGPSKGQVLELVNAVSTDASYVRIADDAGVEPQRFTVEAWITPKGRGNGSGDSAGNMIVSKPEEGAGGSYIQSYGLSWSHGTKNLRAIVSNVHRTSGAILFSNAAILNDQTTHVAMTFDGTWLRIYVNGDLDSEAQTPTDVVDYSKTGDLLIGAANFCCGKRRRFHGSIDEVRIWDHARTAAQISQMKGCPLIGSEQGLLAYYTFDADDATDDSGNGHHGFVNGMADFMDDTRVCPIFEDGFQAADTSSWKLAVP